MSWAIVADSSCNLRGFCPRAVDAVYRVAPLKINIAGFEYVDDASLDVAELNRLVAEEPTSSSSSCPSVGEWAELFRAAENVIAISISARLSGSYEAACIARDMVLEEGPRNIHVVNSRAAGGKLELLVTELDGYLADHPEASFDEAVSFVDELECNSTVLFSLGSYDNLAKSGRMPKLAGHLASKLNIRILGIASDEGTIKIVGPTRGLRKTLDKIVSVMDDQGFGGGAVHIDHVDNEAGAVALAERIRQKWSAADIRILPCGGLCSYYAESKGLIIGFGRSGV